MSRRWGALVTALVAVSTLLAANRAGAAVPSGFSDTLVAAVPSPTAFAFTPDGRMLITTQPGSLRVVQGGSLLASPALNLTTRLCSNSERGLLGVAVDPGFVSNHNIYLYFTDNQAGTCRNRVSRWVLGDDNTVSLGSEIVLIDKIHSVAGNHNGGDLAFGKDGLLYVSVGDSGCDYAGSGCGGANDAARDRNVLVGKILRIDRDGGIPAGNPYQGAGTARCNVDGMTTAGTLCQEIFAWGLRNPFRMAFDPNASGTAFYINDVGQGTWEEIDLGAAGADYGWNVREGHCANGSTTDCGTVAGMTNPIFDYDRSGGCGAITGGAFVPVGVWPAEYSGKYLFADLNCGRIWRLDPVGGGGFNRTEFATVASPVHLAFGPAGGSQALYYTSYGNGGEVRRIGLASSGSQATLSATPNSVAPGGSITATWAGVASPSATDWIGLYSPGAGDGSYLAWRYTTGTAGGNVPFAVPGTLAAGTYELRLFTNNTFSRLATSNTFTVGAGTPGPTSLSVSPTSATPGGQVTATWSGVPTPTATDWIGLYSPGAGDGSYLAWRYTTGTAGGNVPFAVPGTLAAGTYELRLFTNSTFSRLATSNTFTVGAGTPGPTSLSVSPTSATPGGQVTATWAGVPTPTATDWIGLYAPGGADTAFLAWRYTTGAANGDVPFTLPGNLASGTYELRLFTNSTFSRLATSNTFTVGSGTPGPTSLSVSPTSATPGGQVTATWAGVPTPTATDWIGLYAPGGADTAFLAWRYTTGAANGDVPFTLPGNLASGTYELRLFTNSTYSRLATSNALTVGSTGPSLAASPSSIARGGQVTATWAGIPSPTATDWIGMFISDSPNTAYLAWRYTTGSAAGSVPFTIPADVAPGMYELRIFPNNSYNRLATSNSMQVV